ncbi:MAG: DMT family transporter [Gemmobacter sp.]
MPAHLRGALLGLAAFGLYALYDITIKYLGGAYSPVQILFCAGLFALPMVLAQVQATTGPKGLRPVLPGWMALRALVALVNGVLGAFAFALLPLAEAYAVFFTMPLMIALLGVFLLGEPMDLRRGLAVLCGLAGVAVALQPGQAPVTAGHLAALAAAALGALNYVILRRTGRVERPAVLLFWPMAVQLGATGLAMPFLWRPMPPSDLALTLLMAVELVAGGLVIIAAYRAAPVIVVAPMQYSQILWGVAFGALFFDEGLDLPTAIGILIIVASGLVILTHRPLAENRA